MGTMQKVQVLVFDLDGTLYEDTHHFDFYARRMQSRLSTVYQQVFWENYQQALSGEHALKIGRLYDVERDLILVQEKHKVREAYNWEGFPLEHVDVLKLYPERLTIDQVNIISVGDLWWLPDAIAIRYGLSVNGAREAFLETRAFMMSPEFVMKRVEGLKESLIGLKNAGFKLTLLTNSPQKDSEVIISKLGLDDIFHLKVFDGEKPTQTLTRFKEISNHFRVGFHEIVSIGDNLINEIQPAAELGCKTIFIDPHETGKKDDADRLVRSISELIPIFQEMY